MPPHKRLSTADVLLITVLVVTGILVVVAIVVLVAQADTRSYTGIPNIVMFPGRIGLVTENATNPQVQLQVHWSANASASEVFLSGVDAALRVPNHARTSGVLTFLNGAVSPREICDTFAGLTDATFTGWNTQATNVVHQDGLRLPVLGCSQQRNAQGRYASPFLDMLSRKGYTGWTIMERDWRVGVMPGVVTVPCLHWHWTPLLPEPSGQYVIALRPTAAAPWTTALLDFGSYFSVLPGSSSNTSTVTLVTSAGISLFANASFYLSAPGSSLQCVLGVAALAWFSAAALDLKAQRLGLLYTRIGSVQTNSLPFIFT